jgi:hypothetical protein
MRIMRFMRITGVRCHFLLAFIALCEYPVLLSAFDEGSKQNLVLGIDYNVGINELRIFLASLRSSGCTAEVVLFIGSPITVRKRALADRYVTKFVEYDFAEMNRTHGPVGVHRFSLYRKFLETQRDRYELILHTDVRDVVFQEDPFARIEAYGGGVFFLESDHLLIGNSYTNTVWMTENCTVYQHEKMLERTQYRLRSCSGNMYGTAEAVFTYAQMMEEEQQRTAHVQRDAHGNIISGGWCADQAIHQALLWTGKFAARMKNITLHRNEDGPLCTMGDVPHFSIDDIWDVRNMNGEVCAVVHQYDRHESVRDSLLARYAEEDANTEYIHPHYIEGYSPRRMYGKPANIRRHVNVDVSVQPYNSDSDTDKNVEQLYDWDAHSDGISRNRPDSVRIQDNQPYSDTDTDTLAKSDLPPKESPSMHASQSQDTQAQGTAAHVCTTPGTCTDTSQQENSDLGGKYISEESIYAAEMVNLIENLPEYPDSDYHGRGIVMSAGGQLQVCVYMYVCMYVCVYVCMCV